jgi:hypothetical protein
MGKSLLRHLLLPGTVRQTSQIDEDDMSTDDRHHLLSPKTRFALAHAVRALGEWIFDGLAWTSAACHLANSVGFAADEELVARYLAIPCWNGGPRAFRAVQDNGSNFEN